MILKWATTRGYASAPPPPHLFCARAGPQFHCNRSPAHKYIWYLRRGLRLLVVSRGGLRRGRGWQVPARVIAGTSSYLYLSSGPPVLSHALAGCVAAAAAAAR